LTTNIQPSHENYPPPVGGRQPPLKEPSICFNYDPVNDIASI
jgi:hypothetical protein